MTCPMIFEARKCDDVYRERERKRVYYIIVQTYEVGVHSRRHPTTHHCDCTLEDTPRRRHLIATTSLSPFTLQTRQ